MSGGNRPYYDRDDLDEDEKKLFDAMVLEEMEKLERQFESSSIENEGRNQKPPIQQPHQENGYDSRNRQGSSSHQSVSTTADNMSLSNGQSTRRAPRISLVSENFNRSNPILAQNNSIPVPSEKSNAEKRNAQQEFTRPHGEAPRPQNGVQEQQNIPRRARRDESPPESRTENNIISRIGAKDLTMVSTTQKRAQQAEYAMQLAQSSNQSQIGKDHDLGPGYDDGSRLKPRRRPSGGIEDINIISNIGQDSQQLKDRRKSQQQEYAQQLQSQQQQKLRRDSAPSSPRNSNTPRTQDASIYNLKDSQTNSIRSNYNNTDYDNGSSNKNNFNNNIDNKNSNDKNYDNNNNNNNNNNNVHSKNSVVNFGADPNTEALKKKEMKIAYAKQLQEQQSNLQNGRSRVTSESGSTFEIGNGSNYNSNSSKSEYLKSNKDSIIDDDMKRSGKYEDDKNIVNAAMIKRSQQKKYYDDITSAAAAAPITSARVPLRGSGAGAGGQQQRIEEQGTGLQIGGSTSSFLSNADAERLESRSRKVQLQQMYAKQLSDDASVGGGGGRGGGGGSNGQYTNRSDNNYGNDNSYGYDSRGGSGRLGDGYQNNQGDYDNDNSSRNSEMSSPTAGSISGSSHLIFGVMSERDQNALANAKKKAAQQEYYQQLKEVDNKRSDSINSPITSTRTTLYRNREQKDHDDFITGGRDRENSKPLRSQSNQQRGFSDSQNYQNSQNNQGSNYNNRNNSDSGIGSRSQPQSGSGLGPGSQYNNDDLGHSDNSARRRQEDNYNDDEGDDSEIPSNSNLYNSQRSSPYDRNNTGNTEKCRDGDRDRERGVVSSSRYTERESDPEPEMRSDSRSQKFRDRVSDRHESKDENEKYRYEERDSDKDQSRYQDRSDRESQYSPSSGLSQQQGQYYGNDNRQSNETRNSGHSSSRRGSASIENNGRRGYDNDDDSNRYEDERRTQMSSPDTNQEYDDGDQNDSQYHGSDHESNKRQQYQQQQQQQQQQQHYSRQEDHGSNSSRHHQENQGTNGPRSQYSNQFPSESSTAPAGNVKGRGRSSGGGESSISIYG